MNRHIDHHFDEALIALKQQIVLMGSKVQGMVSDCLRALTSKDAALADQIIERDHAVDALEVSIDEQCIELLARYQPAASDLRFLTRGLKIVTDLERIGDLSVNMALRAKNIMAEGEAPLDLTQMASTVLMMLSESIEAFVKGDAARAEGVLKNDDLVDDLTDCYVLELIERSEKEPAGVRRFFATATIVRHLERIADHATNIAELAIFMVKGRDIRHGRSL